MQLVRHKALCTLVGVCGAIVCLVVTVSGCVQRSDKGSKDEGNNSRPFEIRYLNSNPFANQALSQQFAAALGRLRLSQSVTTGLDEDSLWALAQCQCSPGFNASYLQLLVQSRGALPAPLVPAIREEVRNNPTLKALLSLPPGFKNIAGTFANFFINDERINGEIQKGLDERIDNALPGGQSLSSRIKYNFDLYPNPYINLGDAASFHPKTVIIAAQSSKWALVFSIDNMWGSNGQASPLALGDHSLQLLATAITLSEWTYAMGLDSSSTGSLYGGIAFDPRHGVAGALGPSDPRTNPDAAGVISGNYNITFPDKGTLQLATTVQEHWARNTETIPLDEQARIWAATAKAYGRLKPSARSPQLASIFAPQTGMFPDDVHSLPLAFLKGMSKLLGEPFIDARTREIRGAANIYGADRSLVDARARLRTLARMARALQAWTVETETVSQDNLSPDITQTIMQNRLSIKDGMRLAVQAILDQHTEDSVANTRLGGIAMVLSKQDFGRPPMAEVAEALAVMADIDLTTLENQPGLQTDLNKKIIALYHWFAAEYLTDVANQQFPQELTPEAAIWTYVALKNFAKYPPTMTRAPWLQDALKNAGSAVSGWDQQFR